MSGAVAFSTARLTARAWRDDDLASFAALNADARVMEYFPQPLDRTASDELARRIRGHFDRHGFCFWAVEVRESGRFAGFVGLSIPPFEAHFTPCIEIGWRLAHEFWGYGYATEAARGALEYGFDVLKLDEIVSMAVFTNERSQRVMRKLGMTRSPGDDFDHPNLAEGHTLRRHRLYRLKRADWISSPRINLAG